VRLSALFWRSVPFWRRWLRRQGLPADDAADAGARLFIIVDAFEATAQLNSGRQFAALLVCGTDRSGVGFGNHEHRQIMGAVMVDGKRPLDSM
jgi:hypothetical protein